MEWDDLIEDTHAKVDKYGWASTGVFPTEEDNSVQTYFTYTQGFEETLGEPEMLVVGVTPQIAHHILWTFYDRLKAGARFLLAQPIADVLAGDYMVVLRPVDPSQYDGMSNVTTSYYGHEDYRLLQIVLPDTQGRFPWEPNCEEKMVLTQDGAAIGKNLGVM